METSWISTRSITLIDHTPGEAMRIVRAAGHEKVHVLETAPDRILALLLDRFQVAGSSGRREEMRQVSACLRENSECPKHVTAHSQADNGHVPHLVRQAPHDGTRTGNDSRSRSLHGAVQRARRS